MLFILIVLATYTVLILIFVPLERIGKWQTKIRGWEKEIKDKLEEHDK